MNTDTTSPAELDVLTDEEMARVVGGVDPNKINLADVVYNKIGVCGCGVAH